MKNILFVSSYPLPINKGSNQHAFFLLKALSNMFNIYCLFFIPPETDIRFLDNDKIKKLGVKHVETCGFEIYKNFSNKYIDRLIKELSFPYFYMNLATHKLGLEKMLSLIENFSIEYIHFEHFHYTKYLLKCPNHTKKVVVYHDLYHTIPYQMAWLERKITNKLFFFTRFFKLYLFEKIIDKKVYKKIFLNPDDVYKLPKNSEYIPHIVNPEIKKNKPKIKDFYNLLFLGDYNHPPNRASAKYILTRIVPGLIKQTKNFRLNIFGSGTEKLNSFCYNGEVADFVKIHGFIKDINNVFKNMDIAIFPIIYGGGIKTKLIESLAAGIPVVTNRKGINGLKPAPINCINIAKNEKDYISKILLYINHFELRLHHSSLGTEYVQNYHSYKFLSKKLAGIYNSA